jgi:MinD superfamily P-loop ATPase
MKTITILSGKGGTGKTTLSSNLAVVLSKTKKIITADCDSDAPNLGLALGIIEKDFKDMQEVQTNEKAILDEKKCIGCKKCLNICNFGAIKWNNEKNKPFFNSLLCEGCGTCQLVCPTNAIKLIKVNNGKIGHAKTKYNFNLVSGQLNIGSTGSGKVVSLIKKKAEELAKKDSIELMLVDSAAGVGCPVIASIQGSDYIIAVTEPTPSALSDLKRALRTVDHFRIPYGIVINKWDLNKNFTIKIENFMKKYKIPILGKIPYDKKFVEALVKMKPVIEINPEYEKIFTDIIRNIKNQDLIEN